MSKVWLSDRQIRDHKLGGAGRTSLWRYRQDPAFPKPRKLGGKNLTPEHEVDSYLEATLGAPLPQPVEEAQPRDHRGRFGDRDKPPGGRREGRGARLDREHAGAGAGGPDGGRRLSQGDRQPVR